MKILIDVCLAIEIQLLHRTINIHEPSKGTVPFLITYVLIETLNSWNDLLFALSDTLSFDFILKSLKGLEHSVPHNE